MLLIKKSVLIMLILIYVNLRRYRENLWGYSPKGTRTETGNEFEVGVGSGEVSSAHSQFY
jgi:hypothetical protein